MGSLQPKLQISEKATAAFTNQKNQVWHRTRRPAQATARGTNRLRRRLTCVERRPTQRSANTERRNIRGRSIKRRSPLGRYHLSRCQDFASISSQRRSKTNRCLQKSKRLPAAQTLMRSEKPSSAKPFRETRLQAVRRPRTAKPESSASEMETLRSSTEHHTKPGDGPQDITSQCRKQAD